MEGIKIGKDIPRDIEKDIRSKQSFNNKKLNEQQQDTIQVIFYNTTTFTSLVLRFECPFIRNCINANRF